METPIQDLSPKGMMTLRFFADATENQGESASIDDLVFIGYDQYGQFLPSRHCIGVGILNWKPQLRFASPRPSLSS